MRRAQTATATELKNLKNYLRTRGDNLVRLSQSVDKDPGRSSNSSLISAVQRAEPVMLRVSRKSLRAIPKEKLEARLASLAASHELTRTENAKKNQGDGQKENIVGEKKKGIKDDTSPVDMEKSSSFGADTTKLLAQTGFVLL